MSKIYHYTNGLKINKIIDSGVLLTSPRIPKPREKPLVWFSSHPEWEKTANKIARLNGIDSLLNQHETALHCHGLFRFCIDTENTKYTIYQWPKIAVVGKIPDTIKKRLLKRAKLCATLPSQWYGIFEEVDIQDTTIEEYVRGVWTNIDMNEAKPRITDSTMSAIDGGALKNTRIKNKDWGEI